MLNEKTIAKINNDYVSYYKKNNYFSHPYDAFEW